LVETVPLGNLADDRQPEQGQGLAWTPASLRSAYICKALIFTGTLFERFSFDNKGKHDEVELSTLSR
jgi:hypothetical protein